MGIMTRYTIHLKDGGTMQFAGIEPKYSEGLLWFGDTGYPIMGIVMVDRWEEKK